MDLDRTTLGDGTRDLRARAQAQGRPELPTDSPAPQAPDHGGPLAASQVDEHQPTSPDPQAEARRKQAHDSIARFLQIPGSTELDIRVDTEADQVRFLIRDRETGELIREVPEGESGPLVDKLRDYAGTLLDRSV